MRIGIDARFYGVVKQGLGRYCEQLVQQLAKLDTHNEYVIFVAVGQRFNGLPGSFKVVECPYRWYGISEQLRWPFFVRRFHLDLMHFTSFNVPMLYRKPYLVTLHDLILIHFPSAHASTLHPWHFAAKRYIYRKIVRSAARRARCIIAVSQYTADDIRTILGVTAPLSVIYQGSDIPASDSSTQSTMQGPPQPFFLYVGNAYPHKNLPLLIDTFIDWRTEHSSYSLALVGKRDYFYERLQKQYGNQRSIYWMGEVSDTDLIKLYGHAAGFVFPSLYEGFGMPPLEAMRFRTPVISSNAACMPEVLGDAALYFDPHDGASLRNAFNVLISDVQTRDARIERGVIRSQRYSWERMGTEVLKLYSELEKQYTNTEKQTLNGAAQKKKTDR